MTAGEARSETLAQIIVRHRAADTSVLADDITTEVHSRLTLLALPPRRTRAIERVSYWNTGPYRSRAEMCRSCFMVVFTVVPAGVWLARSIVGLALLTVEIDHALAEVAQRGDVGAEAGAIVLTRL